MVSNLGKLLLVSDIGADIWLSSYTNLDLLQSIKFLSQRQKK